MTALCIFLKLHCKYSLDTCFKIFLQINGKIYNRKTKYIPNYTNLQKMVLFYFLYFYRPQDSASIYSKRQRITEVADLFIMK